MDYSVYSGGGYHDSWARWVMDNMQGNMPNCSLPAPPPMRQDLYNARTNLESALMIMKQAMEGEENVRNFYEYMLDAVPSEDDREIIAGIQHDDLRHFSLLRQAYYDISGEKPAPAQPARAVLPVTYTDGLIAALMGEQQAAVTYRKVLFAMRNRRHINMLTEIITDELRHLGLYNYLLTKNSRSL